LISPVTVDRLIINRAYIGAKGHWRYECETRLFDLLVGECPADCMVASESSKAFDHSRMLVEIHRVKQIGPGVKPCI